MTAPRTGRRVEGDGWAVPLAAFLMKTSPPKLPLRAARFVRGRRSALARGAAAGFTLLELLAVILIIGVLGAALYPTIASSISGGKTAACEQNLKRIGEGLAQYNIKYESWPRKSGVPFFGSLIGRGVWESTPANAKRLTCPAIGWKNMMPSQEFGLDLEDWFRPDNFDQVGPDHSTYAGPDLSRTKLRKFPASGNVAIIADDNYGDGFEGNHDTATNVLMGDLSVRRLEVFELKDSGDLPSDESVTFIPVGPDSPIELLQGLTIDE